MDASIRTSSDWYAALALDERLPLPPATGLPADSDAAMRRLDRWRSSPPFAQGDLLAQRLASAGIDGDGLRRLLGESPAQLAARVERPAFIDALAGAFASESGDVTPLPDGPLALVEPLVASARVRLAAVIDNIRRRYPAAPFDPDTAIDLFVPALTTQLGAVLGRTFVLELQVARLFGRLDGATPEARHASFARSLRNSGQAIALLREYPVLARLAQETVDRWVAASGEFLDHLARDADALRDTFNGGHPLGTLLALDGGRGDRHRGGRAVMVASFDGGLRVVYKPRSLAVEVHFQQLLDWLNARGAAPSFPLLTVLDRGDHGWAEYVSAAGCASRDDVRRFYTRQGGYLALLYALEATDFHYENLIAAGEHPVLLDLEALFHPRANGFSAGHADDAAETGLLYSVLGVGLLPQRVWEQGDADGIDISGLGGAGGQLTPFAALALDGAGTDEMRMTRRRMPVPPSHNRPTLNGRHPELADHTGDLVAGFEQVYRLLLAHRDDLLGADGPVAAFAADELRVILRPTQLYGRLLQESHHPDVLRDALDRDRLFDRLWGWVESVPSLARVIPDEQADLRRGDIPVFTTRPESRDLWASDGRRIPDYFDVSGLELVRRRLGALGDADLGQQVWIIRSSLAATSATSEPSATAAYRLVESDRRPDRGQLLDAACRIGDRLTERAIREPGEATWVGLHAGANRRWTLAPVTSSLYDGQAGIALFLARIGDVTGDHRYSDLARDAVASLRRMLDRERGVTAAIGGYVGWGGVIHALTQLGTLWDDATLLDEAEAIVDLIPPLLDQVDALDVLSGAAGAAAALLALDTARPASRALAVATACADHLLARAVPVPGGLGWRAGALPSLTGFTHGAAGIAWSLLGVAHRTRDDRFRQTARAAIAAERAVFDPAAGNWPDLRPPEAGGHVSEDGSPAFMTTWCHGAPGIGLGRLRSVALDADPVAWDEVAIAARTTRAHGFGGGHSLCHGDLGNLEFLIAASERLGLDRDQLGIDALTGSILDSIARDGWMCGVPAGLETPGLMTGIAGIGYALLRIADPVAVPSILTLEPPRAVARAEVAA
jgi:type 2 lantibiotic biosynthesis protein LanM